MNKKDHLEEFHFYYLPFERTYLRLKNKFRIKIFNKGNNKLGSYNLLAKKLNCTSQSILNWKNNKCAIPTIIIINLSKIINEEEFNLKNIEENIIKLMTGKKSAKQGSVGKNINCKFPLKFSAKLAHIVSHIMGDGTININYYFNTIYFNNQIEIINELKEDLLEVFGDIRTNINKGKDNVYYINIPSIIGMILYYWFGEFSSKNITIPKIILESDLNTKSKFLQGIFDDEGTIDKKHKTIRFGTTSENLSNNVRLLIKDFGIKPTNLYKIKYLTKINKLEGYIYNFGITNKRGLHIFNKEIGFNHPKKRELLNNICSINN